MKGNEVTMQQLKEVENEIAQLAGVCYFKRSTEYNGQAFSRIKKLLHERKQLMNDLFELTEDSFLRFQSLNATLLDQTNRLYKKMGQLYRQWLTDEEDEWNNECEMEGAIMVGTTMDFMPDSTGSCCWQMMDIIDRVGGDNLLRLNFTGNRDEPFDESGWGLAEERPTHHFNKDGAEQPYGDFLMCKAFERLQMDSLYAKQDILQLDLIWANAGIVHQRVVNPEGKLA